MQLAKLRTRRVSALAVLLLTSTALPALALDADDFATKLNAAYGTQSGQIDYASATSDGDTVILKDARIIAPGQDGFPVGNITFEGVSETVDGGYVAEKTTIAKINHTVDGTKIIVEEPQLTGLEIPAKPDLASLNGMIFYRGFTTGPIFVSVKGKEVFKLAGIQTTVDKHSDGKQVDIDMSGNGVWIDTQAIGDGKSRQTMRDIGYETLTGSMKINASWEVETGRLNMPEYSFTLDDAGKLSMSLDISGYTLQFVKALADANKSVANSADKKAAQQAMGLTMLGMMQQLTFSSASIRFDDASLTGRLLGYAGKQQGVSGEQMAQAAKGMMPLILGQLGIPALQQQISAAASTYLDNPENLTITAKPAQPVPFTQIMGAAMGDPRQLADVLNVQVTAND